MAAVSRNVDQKSARQPPRLRHPFRLRRLNYLSRFRSLNRSLQYRRQHQTYFLRAKQATIRILKDPDSAKFADLFASRGSPRIICGLINAKNGYGGYTGMTPFTYYADTDKAVIAQGLSNGETIRALKTWQQECRP